MPLEANRMSPCKELSAGGLLLRINHLDEVTSLVAGVTLPPA
jgi:hypothetical protein